MTPEQINAAIAETLGWVDIEPIAKDAANWGREGGWDGPLRRIPNYHGSLDAIVPVIREMHANQRYDFYTHLIRICKYETFLATPAQWCEAYLRAKSLWK